MDGFCMGLMEDQYFCMTLHFGIAQSEPLSLCEQISLWKAGTTRPIKIM